jgi:hypothetical protein
LQSIFQKTAEHWFFDEELLQVAHTRAKFKFSFTIANEQSLQRELA